MKSSIMHSVPNKEVPLCQILANFSHPGNVEYNPLRFLGNAVLNMNKQDAMILLWVLCQDNLFVILKVWGGDVGSGQEWLSQDTWVQVLTRHLFSYHLALSMGPVPSLLMVWERWWMMNSTPSALWFNGSLVLGLK